MTRKITRLTSVALTLVVALTGLTVSDGSLAFAAAGDDVETVRKIAPEILNPANRESDPSKLQRGVGGADTALRFQEGGRTIIPKRSEEATESIKIRLDSPQKLKGAKQGIVIVEDELLETNTYVQPLENGVRIVSEIPTHNAKLEFSYGLEIPQDAIVTELASGTITVTSASTKLSGAFAAPWARDAEGKSVRTTYEWAAETSTLTQKVFPDTETVFPVLADPAWGYSLQYVMGFMSPLAISGAMQDCFNCYFPLAGAPRDFPTIGQFLPLTVLGVNFNCIFYSTYTNWNPAEVWRPEMSGFGFRFLTAEGHPDGLGSSIAFDFHKVGNPDGDEPTYFTVSTWIVGNDLGDVGNHGYVIGAENSWKTFAINIMAAFGEYNGWGPYPVTWSEWR